MIRYPIAYLITAAIFAVLDFGWISVMTPRLYRPELGSLLIDGARPVPALLFYVIYMLGVTGLCVLPSLPQRTWGKAVGAGVLLGLAAYSAYDLTNQATLKVWSTKVTVADLAWGAFATAAASGLSVIATSAALRALGQPR